MILYFRKETRHKIAIIDFILFRLTTAKKSGKCLRKGSEAKRWEATVRLNDIGVYMSSGGG
jgi:hypothetical protein